MDYSETARWLGERDHFLIITHLRPDGDTLGSAAGLCQGLRDKGKTAYILPNPEATERYLEYVKPYYAPEGFEPETVITVDTAGRNLFPLNIGDYGDRVELAIDHHASHAPYAPNTCVYGKHAACGEIIYLILCEMDVKMTERIATALYIAIVTDTGCFRYSNTNSTTLRICADLMEYDVPASYLNKKFFRTKSRARIMIESMMLANMQLFDSGTIGIVTLTNEMMKKADATEDDTDDIASLVGQVEGVRASVTIRELEDGTCKISLRTGPDLNASDVCAQLGGGGHKAAAGCTLDAGVEESKRLILDAIQKIRQKSRVVEEPVY
ncbi:MAG: DHH family phosphoesterase [Oscillospiraceae bacterium]|jgi:phosphoesterase RecJ-like protein